MADINSSVIKEGSNVEADFDNDFEESGGYVKCVDCLDTVHWLQEFLVGEELVEFAGYQENGNSMSFDNISTMIFPDNLDCRHSPFLLNPTSLAVFSKMFDNDVRRDL